MWSWRVVALARRGWGLRLPSRLLDMQRSRITVCSAGILLASAVLLSAYANPDHEVAPARFLYGHGALNEDFTVVFCTYVQIG